MEFVKLSRLFPAPNNCPTSVKVLKRIFRNMVRDKMDTVIPQIHKFVQHNNDTAFEASYFFCDIMQHITLIVETYGDIILKFLADCSRVRDSNVTVTDMITAEFYKKFLPNPSGRVLYLHLLLSADGARFTKAKKGNFWPVHATIAELPPKLRAKFENSILLALWQGEKKLDWDTIFHDPIKQLKMLQNIGLPVTINGLLYSVRVRVLAVVFDLPARVSVWNVIQYNGEYACMQCMQKGEHAEHKRTWPFENQNATKTTTWYKNTYADLKNDLVNPPFFGVKGESILSHLNLDPAIQSPLDLMHQTYEGVFNRILNSLFGTHKTPWNFGKSALQITTYKYLGTGIQNHTVLQIQNGKDSMAKRERVQTGVLLSTSPSL